MPAARTSRTRLSRAPQAPRSARRSRRRWRPGVAAVAAGAAGRAEFAAPLDEAYSTCVLDVARGGAPGSLRFELAPYGPRRLERPRAHRHVQDGSD
jgi:hypothetical protein